MTEGTFIKMFMLLNLFYFNIHFCAVSVIDLFYNLKTNLIFIVYLCICEYLYDFGVLDIYSIQGNYV